MAAPSDGGAQGARPQGSTTTLGEPAAMPSGVDSLSSAVAGIQSTSAGIAPALAKDRDQVQAPARGNALPAAPAVQVEPGKGPGALAQTKGTMGRPISSHTAAPGATGRIQQVGTSKRYLQIRSLLIKKLI